jgi:hypothetical protein
MNIYLIFFIRSTVPKEKWKLVNITKKLASIKTNCK